MSKKNKGYPILAPLVPRTLVNASELAAAQGWHEPTRWRWPGEVIHEKVTSSGKMVVQFLIFEPAENQYVLKTWDKRLLALARQSEIEALKNTDIPSCHRETEYD